MKKKQFDVSLLCFLILLLCAGCNQPSNTALPDISNSLTPNVPVMPHTPIATQPTPTRTSIPTPSPTVTSTTIPPTATPTPVPTLNPTERQLYLEERLPTNNDCALPCWLGIIPGKTTWQEARTFVRYLGIGRMSELELEDGETLHSFGGFDFEIPRLLQRFYLLEQAELVKGLALMIEGDKAPKEFQTVWVFYSPRNIMLEYGPPSRVWLDTTSETPGDVHGYGLILAYDEIGIIIHYEGFLTKIGSNLRFCPRFEEGMDIEYMEVYLQAADDPRPLDEFGGVLDRHYLIEQGKRIEEASGLSEQQFYELFAQTEQPACFTSPADIWP